jgi:transposase
MRKISEVLRLRAQGRSIREIADSVGVGHTAVSEYLRRAEAAGLAWPLPEGVGAEELDARLFPPPFAVPGALRPVPDWREVHRELKARKGVTRRLLWLEWREAHPDGWGYSQFCWHYEQWLGSQDVVMRLSYAAGERMFVGFSGDRAPWFDPETGEEHFAEVFGPCWAARASSTCRPRPARTSPRGSERTSGRGSPSGVSARSRSPTTCAPGCPRRASTTRRSTRPTPSWPPSMTRWCCPPGCAG